MLARGFHITVDNVRSRCDDKCRKYLEKTQWMKKRDLERLQLKRLKKLLTQAYENVPYYRESFESKKFRPTDLKTLEDLRKVPILRKSKIRRNLNKMIANNYPRKKLTAFFTSGTTAAPLRFYRGKTDLCWGIGAGLRAHGWADCRLGDKRALVWEYQREQSRSLPFKIFHLLMRDKIFNVRNISEETMASFARKMHRFKPDFIQGYSTSVNLFAAFILENSQFKISPKAVFTSAATLLPNYRRTIEEAFDCKVYDFYGSREITSIAAQCGECEGLHVSDENIILEIVRDSEPVSPGEEGQILLTNLHSHAMPFIRYDIGDLGRLFPDTCSCGRELSLMKPTGRTYEYFINSDGSFTYLRDFQIVFEDLPIKEYQVIQQSHDEIIISLVPGPGYSSAHSDFIVKNIRHRGKAKIKVELVDSIPTENSGKTRHIVRKIASKYT
jgi:phenylacetate-CoA ligase